MTQKRGVLFDLDGVLVRTEHLKAKSHALVIEALGSHASPYLYKQVMGQSFELVRDFFLASAGIEEADFSLYSQLFDQTYRHLMELELEVTPGVPELLQFLKRRGCFLGVVSSSPAKIIKYILRKTALSQFFHTIVSSDEPISEKPSPEPYLLALRKLGLMSDEVIAIEDSQAGVEAAVKAGLLVIALRHPYNEQHDFSLAHSIVSSLSGPDIYRLIDRWHVCTAS